MANVTLPQLGKAAYIALRKTLRRTVPAKLTVPWVLMNVQGYQSERSAAQLIRTLELLHLVNEADEPTEILHTWRMDETYAEACSAILEASYPPELVQAVSGGNLDALVLRQRIMSFVRVGEGTARNAAGLILILTDPEPPTEDTSRPERASGAVTPAKPRGRPGLRGLRRRDEPPTPTNSSDPERLKVEYVVGRNRMASVFLPASPTGVEITRLIEKLTADMDLLAVDAESGAEL